MIVETYCDRCGMQYDWAGVTRGDLVFCCSGCATGGPCICPMQSGATTTVIDTGGDTVVVAGKDDVVIV